MRRPLVVRVLAICAVSAVLAGCSSDDGGASAGSGASRSTTVAPSGSDPAATGPTTTLAPTTTFMADCAVMPTPAAISAAVGVPMGDGQVIGSGACQYLGLNDQSKSVLLGLFTDPGDQATFNDLQTSLGAPTKYKDKALPGAMVGVDHTLFVTANGAIYTVLTSATDQPPADQVALSAALLKVWLTL